MKSGYKICITCKRSKPLNKFNSYKIQFKGVEGISQDCSQCALDKYSIKTKPKPKKSKKKYNKLVTTEEYDRLYNKQDGRCKICSIHQFNHDKPLCVDHDHKTGEIRGLLCNQCNLGLGLFKDNPDSLLNAIKYLLKKLT